MGPGMRPTGVRAWADGGFFQKMSRADSESCTVRGGLLIPG
jgi:hypothetical protein